MDFQFFWDKIELDRTSLQPLHLQLGSQLAKLFRVLPVGTMIPPERLMAEKLGVSRVTVRSALRPFFERGEIIRRRHRGSITARPSGELVEEDASRLSHSAYSSRGAMSMSFPWLVSPILRFLCYENLGPQKQFWNRVVEEYCREFGGGRIEIVWDSEGILDYSARCRNCDIFLYSPILEQEISQLAIPLPEDIRKSICTMEHPLAKEFERYDSVFRYIQPVNLLFPQLFWNKNMACQCGLGNVEKRLENNEIFDMITEAAQKLPVGYFAASHIWDYAANFVHRPGCAPDSEMESFLSAIQPCCGIETSFLLKQPHCNDMVRLFNEGKILFLLNYVTALQALNPPEFPMGSFPCRLNPVGCIPVFCVGVCGAAESQFPTEVETFLRFLLNPAVQKAGSNLKGTLPVTLGEAEGWFQRQNCSSTYSNRLWKNAELWMSQNGLPEKYCHFLAFRARNELLRFVQGKSSLESTASLLRQNWKNYQKTI